MQEWWAGSADGDRGRDDRVRDGDRQGRRPLRLPLQPAEEPRVVLAGDRPRRPRRRGEHLRAVRLPGRRAHAGELRLRRHADARGARRPARGRARASRRRGVRRVRVRALRAPRPAPARAQDGPHLPRARRRAAAGNAVLRGLPPASARRRAAGGRLRPLRRVARRLPAPPDRDGQDGPDLDDARARRRRGGARRGAQPDPGGARVPRPAGPDRAATVRGPPALHGSCPPRLRPPSSSSACSSASRAASARRPDGSRTCSRSSPTTAARCAPSSATSARRARSRAGTAATA